MIIVMVLIVALGVPFTLWWWKQADKDEAPMHRRFQEPPDQRERIVLPRAPRQSDTQPALGETRIPNPAPTQASKPHHSDARTD